MEFNDSRLEDLIKDMEMPDLEDAKLYNELLEKRNKNTRRHL